MTDDGRNKPLTPQQESSKDSEYQFEKSIPVMGESYSISKKTTRQEFVIEKR